MSPIRRKFFTKTRPNYLSQMDFFLFQLTYTNPSLLASHWRSEQLPRGLMLEGDEVSFRGFPRIMWADLARSERSTHLLTTTPFRGCNPQLRRDCQLPGSPAKLHPSNLYNNHSDQPPEQLPRPNTTTAPTKQWIQPKLRGPFLPSKLNLYPNWRRCQPKFKNQADPNAEDSNLSSCPAACHSHPLPAFLVRVPEFFFTGI